jgi:putative flippase GtrA
MIIRQYIKFFVNGGILGIISLGLQTIIYHAIGLDSGLAYALASALTYVPLIVINFIIQRKWIFQRDGMFWRFLLANLSIMLLVSLLSPLCRLLIAWAAGAEWGDRGGFALAAIAMSIPSFFLKRLFVFNAKHMQKSY